MDWAGRGRHRSGRRSRPAAGRAGQERHQPLGDGHRAGPGPPPPWGVAKVLCRFMWTMSKPMSPGRTTPRMALRLAPS
jgi:hypothetical protein